MRAFADALSSGSAGKADWGSVVSGGPDQRECRSGAPRQRRPGGANAFGLGDRGLFPGIQPGGGSGWSHCRPAFDREGNNATPASGRYYASRGRRASPRTAQRAVTQPLVSDQGRKRTEHVRHLYPRIGMPMRWSCGCRGTTQTAEQSGRRRWPVRSATSAIPAPSTSSGRRHRRPPARLEPGCGRPECGSDGHLHVPVTAALTMNGHSCECDGYGPISAAVARELTTNQHGVLSCHGHARPLTQQSTMYSHPALPVIPALPAGDHPAGDLPAGDQPTGDPETATTSPVTRALAVHLNLHYGLDALSGFRRLAPQPRHTPPRRYGRPPARPRRRCRTRHPPPHRASSTGS